MILVVNPNPAVDRVAVVRFAPRATLRPERFSLWAGGSGVHAAYVARLLGAEVLVLGFAGGHHGALFRELLARQDLPAELVEVDGETRGTYSLLDVEQGELCNVPELGPTVSAAAAERLEALARARIPEAALVVVSGSVPPGCPPALPARLVAACRQAGVPCIADLAGGVLRAAIGERPWLVKPSRGEIAELTGRGDVGNGEALELARDWVAAGVGNVCVSLDAQGLLWVAERGARRFVPPAVPAYNAIGCGDALVGALAATYVATGDLEHSLRAGVAGAAANLAYDAPGYCTLEDVARLADGVTERSLPSPPPPSPRIGRGGRRVRADAGWEDRSERGTKLGDGRDRGAASGAGRGARLD